MQLELSKIKASPSPVRTTQDEEKMEELRESIGEYGQLQAIKVRPVEDGYEVVFGNRRVEASRRLGNKYIEAVVEDLNESTTMIHALIENVVREDLGALDVAKGLKALKDATGWTTPQMAAQGFMGAARINRALALLQEPVQIQEMITTNMDVGDVGAGNKNCTSPTQAAKVSAHHIRLVRESGLAEHARIKVLKKAAAEGLTAKQTREVADAYRDAKTPQAREMLMELPTVRTDSIKKAAREIAIHGKDEEKVWWAANASEGAKNLVRRIRVDREGWNKAWLIVERGAIGPEHMPYIEKRLRSLGNLLIKRADELNDRREKAVQGGTDDD